MQHKWRLALHPFQLLSNFGTNVIPLATHRMATRMASSMPIAAGASYAEDGA